jgi:hypothetical protein
MIFKMTHLTDHQNHKSQNLAIFIILIQPLFIISDSPTHSFRYQTVILLSNPSANLLNQ